MCTFPDEAGGNLKETAQRANAVREAWEAAGGRFIGIWWTFGKYDGVVVHEAPDDKTANRLLLATGMQGNVRTTTLRAFGEEEIEGVLKDL
ncbi:MAG: GYD domain-containing protein [Chloroflexi bacterium]|nr:GYD domain-containing protein [Chloroflexota bacterium]